MKTFAILFLILICNVARADWERAFTTDDNIPSYWDESTLRSNGNTFKIWTLQDFPSARSLGPNKIYWSTKLLLEFNCTEFQFKMSSAIHAAGHMGGGEVVDYSDYSSSRFVDIPPNSFAATIAKHFCK